MDIRGKRIVVGTLREDTCPLMKIKIYISIGEWIGLQIKGKPEFHHLTYFAGQGKVHLTGIKRKPDSVSVQKLITKNQLQIKEYVILWRRLFTINRCKTTEEYTKCIFDWISGRMYCTDASEKPISKTLIEEADKLQVQSVRYAGGSSFGRNCVDEGLFRWIFC